MCVLSRSASSDARQRGRPRRRTKSARVAAAGSRGVDCYHSGFMPDTGLFSLDDEVAVVIGGGGVLAGAMADALAAAGPGVAILGRTQENADKRAQSIAANGGHALSIQCDTTSKA